MFSGLLDSFNADPVVKEYKGYIGQGMDYLSNMLPDRETMKGYIDGPYDDYVIDKVADGYGYLRGLLDEAPDPYAGYDPTAEYMELNQPAPQAYDPTAEAMAVQAMPEPSSIAQLFQRKRPRIMDAVQGAYEASPRPHTGSQDLARNYRRDYPEYKALRDLDPSPNAITMYQTMQGKFRQPEGLLGGQMAPKGFAAEEATVQPMPQREFAKPIEQLQDNRRYLDSSTRGRVKRGQDLEARMMAEKRRIRNALAR